MRARLRSRTALVAASIAVIALSVAASYELVGQDGSNVSAPVPASVVPPRAPELEPGKLITIGSEADVDAMRSRLIGIIWGTPALPRDLPVVEKCFLGASDRAAFDSAASSVETLVTRMDAGIESRALHFVPRNGNGEVVLLHEGHAPFRLRTHQIASLLGSGYGVIVLWMPLQPPNPQLDVRLETGELIRLETHGQLAFLSPEHGHPVQYLLEPVIRALNFVERSGRYRRVSMIGMSGGGWATVMVAAVDPRVTTSVPIAGSLPLYLRTRDPNDWGDWEETLPEIYRRVGYLDLYVLGGHGCGRSQLQLFLEHDTCCYGGTAPDSYAPVVRDAVSALGAGSFDVVIDHHYRGHDISPLAWRTALDALGAARPCR